MGVTGAHVFAQVAALLVLATADGLIGLLLRQPLIVSFLVVGLVAGPGGLGLVHHADHLQLLASSALRCCCSWSG